jgi:hypothetical protein
MQLFIRIYIYKYTAALFIAGFHPAIIPHRSRVSHQICKAFYDLRCKICTLCVGADGF